MRLRSGVKTASGDNSPDSLPMKPGTPQGSMGAEKCLQFAGFKINYVVCIVHLNIFLYATCFWIQQGVFPYLSSKLGSGSVMYGYLQTTFAVVQLCGGPIYGRFGDLYGGRAALTLAFIASAISYGLLGVAGSIPMLFLSRLPSLAMHAMQGGQMVVTDVADSEQRVGALGKLSISYGVGMVIGPFLAGLISRFYGEQSAAMVACGGSVLSALICCTQLPAHTKKTSSDKPAEDSGCAVLNPSKFLSIMKQEKAFSLLMVRFITGIPIGIFQSMFPIVAKDTYGLDAEHNGYIMSYIGILSMCVQGLGMGYLKSRFSEMQLIKGGVFVLIWAYLLLVFVGSNIWQLVFILAPLVFGLAVLTIVISAALTNSVPDQDTGAILGINMAVNSLIRTVSPTAGGYILEWYGFPSFGYIGFVDSAVVLAFLVYKYKE